MSFGIFLKELRLKNNLTQSELADKLDLDLLLISRYEQGSLTPPLGTLVSISIYFDISLSFLAQFVQDFNSQLLTEDNIDKVLKENGIDGLLFKESFSISDLDILDLDEILELLKIAKEVN